MKPTRIRMAHSLVMNYGLYKHMEIFVCIRPHPISSLPIPSSRVWSRSVPSHPAPSGGPFGSFSFQRVNHG